MDKFPKTRKELSDLLDERLAGWECQGRSMFGGRSYFVNGNMFSGSHGDTIAIRLSEPDRAEFLEEYPEASIFEPMPGKSDERVHQPPLPHSSPRPSTSITGSGGASNTSALSPPRRRSPGRGDPKSAHGSWIVSATSDRGWHPIPFGV